MKPVPGGEQRPRGAREQHRAQLCGGGVAAAEHQRPGEEHEGVGKRPQHLSVDAEEQAEKVTALERFGEGDAGDTVLGRVPEREPVIGAGDAPELRRGHDRDREDAEERQPRYGAPAHALSSSKISLFVLILVSSSSSLVIASTGWSPASPRRRRCMRWTISGG